MALDPNIILQARGVQLDSPLDTYGRVAQVQTARNQNRIADLAFADKARASAADSSLAGLLAGGSSGADVVKGLASQGYGSQALAYQKTNQEALKSAADIKKTEADTIAKQQEQAQHQFEIAGQLAGSWATNPGISKPLIQAGINAAANAGVLTPQVAQAQLSELKKVGDDPRSLNGWAATKQQQVISAKDQMTNALAQQRDAETRRSNMAREANSAGQLAVSRGNLGLAQQRLSFDRQAPRGQIVQSELGTMLVDPRTGEAKPVTLNGSPLSTGAKMTEDQGKATGWLIQAENAYGNMLKAIDPKSGTPSASKPGINDAISQIPLIGDAIGNSLRGANRQKFLQGTSSLSEALLRAATGAGVNKEEAAQKVKEITPVAGDTDEVIAQKMDAIPLYLDSLKVRAGPGAKKAAVVIDNSRAKKSQGNIFDQADAILGGK